MIKAIHNYNKQQCQSLQNQIPHNYKKNQYNYQNDSPECSGGNFEQHLSEYRNSYQIKQQPISSTQNKTPTTIHNSINNKNHANFKNHNFVAHSPLQSISNQPYFQSVYSRSSQNSPKLFNPSSSSKNSVNISPYKQIHNSSLKRKYDFDEKDQGSNNYQFQNNITKQILKTPKSALDHYEVIPFRNIKRRSNSNNIQYDEDIHSQRLILPQIIGKENNLQSEQYQQQLFQFQQPYQNQKPQLSHKKRNYISFESSRNKLDYFDLKQVDNGHKQQQQQEFFNIQERVDASFDMFQKVLKEVRDTSSKKNQQHRITNQMKTIGLDEDVTSSSSKRNQTFDNYYKYLEEEIPLYHPNDRYLFVSSGMGEEFQKRNNPSIPNKLKPLKTKIKARANTLIENVQDKREETQENSSRFVYQSKQNTSNEKNTSSQKSPNGKNKKIISSSTKGDNIFTQSGNKCLDYDNLLPYWKGKKHVDNNKKLQDDRILEKIEDIEFDKIRKPLRNSHIRRRAQQQYTIDEGSGHFLSNRYSTSSYKDNQYFLKTQNRENEIIKGKIVELSGKDYVDDNCQDAFIQIKEINDLELYKQYVLYKLQKHNLSKLNDNDKFNNQEDITNTQKLKSFNLPSTYYSQKLDILEKKLQRRNTENDIIESKLNEELMQNTKKQNSKQQPSLQKTKEDTQDSLTYQNKQSRINSDCDDILLNLSCNSSRIIEQWVQGDHLRLQCQLNMMYGEPISTQRRNFSPIDFIFVIDNQELLMNQKGWQIKAVLKNFIRELDDTDSVCVLTQNNLKNEFEQLTELNSEKKRKNLFKIIDCMQKTEKSGIYNLLLHAFKIASQNNDKQKLVNILVFGNNDGIQTYWRVISNLLFQTPNFFTTLKDSHSVKNSSLISLNSYQQSQQSSIITKFFCFDIISPINRLSGDIYEIAIDFDGDENGIKKIKQIHDNSNQHSFPNQLSSDQQNFTKLNMNIQQINQKQQQFTKNLFDIVEQNEEDSSVTNSGINLENLPEFNTKISELQEFSKIVLQKIFNIQQQECLLEVRVNPMFKDIFKIVEFYENSYNQDSESHVYIFSQKLIDKGEIKTIAFEIEADVQQFSHILKNKQFIFQENPIIQAIFANNSKNIQVKNDLFLNVDEKKSQIYQNTENSEQNHSFKETLFYRSKIRHFLQKFCCQQNNNTPSDSTNLNVNLIQNLQIIDEEIKNNCQDKLEKQNLENIIQNLNKEIISQNQQVSILYKKQQ